MDKSELRKRFAGIRRGQVKPEAGQSSSERRRLYALKNGVVDFITRHGIERCGFLTLTFADNLRWDVAKDWAEAGRRWDGFIHHSEFSAWVGDWGRVTEPQKSGRIHYHIIVALSVDIRTGFDFPLYLSAVSAGRRFSACEVGASSDLRRAWAVCRESCGVYHFGRSELLPIREAAAGVAAYVGKYVAHTAAGYGEQKFRARRIAWASGVGKGSRVKKDFAWVGKGEPWRAALVWWADKIGRQNLETVQAEPSWAWRHGDNILREWREAGAPGCIARCGIRGLAGLPVGWLSGARVLVVGARQSAVAGDLGPLVRELRASGCSVVRVDCDIDRGLCIELDVQAVPAVLVLRDGIEVGRWVGVQRADRLTAEVCRLLGLAQVVQDVPF